MVPGLRARGARLAGPARAPIAGHGLPAGRSGAGHRLRHATAGTPALRIHGTGALLLLAAAQPAEDLRLPPAALRALRALSVTAEQTFDGAAREAFGAWDGLRGGERAAELP